MNDIAIEQTKILSTLVPSETAVRKASDRLAREITKHHEEVFRVRTCSSCGETLPLDKTHFAYGALSRLKLLTRCRACCGGYSSWSAREERQAYRQRLSSLKNSPEWKRAQVRKHNALAMLPFFGDLTDVCWRAWDCDIPMDLLADKLLEIAEHHNRVDFLETYSKDFVMVVEGNGEDVDLCEMARTWQHYYRRWQEKAVAAIDTMERMMNEFDAAEELRAA